MANTHSLDLEASSSQCAYIEDASQTGLDLSDDFTIEAWVNWESLPSSGNIHFIAEKGTVSDISYHFRLYNNAGTYRLEAVVSNNGTNYDYVYCNITTPTTGTWYHYAVTCDISNAVATEFEFFVDGVSQGNGTVSVDGSVTSLNNNGRRFYIGALEGYSTTSDKFLDGKIDEVRVWNVIRSDADINTYKRKDVTGQTGLVAYWKFNNSALDETSNNNDLTLFGSPSYSTTVPFNLYTTSGFMSLL